VSLTTYTLLHYEDEPLSVTWLEEQIYFTLCRSFVHFAAMDEEVVIKRNEETRQTTFDVPPTDQAAGDQGNNGGLQVIYRICTTQQAFTDAVKDVSDPATTVVILDLMEQRERGLVTSGLDCYNAIPDSIPKGRCFFLSGYAKQIPEDIREQVDEQYIYSKPVNYSAFGSAVLTALNLPSDNRS